MAGRPATSLWRYVPLAALLCGGIVLSVGGFCWFYARQEDKLRSEFTAAARDRAFAIQAAVDAHSLALVLNELTTNAIKYALGERERMHLSLDVELDGDTVRCTFRDDGPGYPEEILDRTQLAHDQRPSGRQTVGLDLIRNILRDNLRGELFLRNDDASGAVAIVQFRAEAETEGHGSPETPREKGI